MFATNHTEKIEKLAEKGKMGKIISFTKSKDAADRAAAAAALGGASTDDTYNALISLLQDPDVNVQINTVQSLQKLERKSATEHIKHVAAHTSDETLLAACRSALGSLNRTTD